jgi:hypothetical protein
MSQTKVKSGLLNFPDQTDFVKLPSGTTAQRPPSPEKGYSRYNTTDNKLEYWNGTIWQQLPGVVAPTIETVSYPGDDLAADPDGGQTITLTGTNFLAGATVEIEGALAPVVTVVSKTEITFTAPAKTSGDYNILLTNGDNTTATFIDGITYNGLPSWTTPAGNLGSFPAGSTIPTITLVATEPDSGVVSYSVTTGALPTGLALTGADIDGTVPSPAGQTTYNFSVTASDDENQESTERAFNIVVYLQVTNTVDEVDPFGDSSGIALYRLENNANDEGGVYNGTSSNVTYGAGVFGQAGIFNGSNSKININSLVYPVSLKGTVSEFTISLWFKSYAAPSGSEEFLTWWSGDGNDVYLDGFLGLTSGNTIRSGDNWTSSYTFPDTSYVNRWNHISLLKTSDNAFLYLNGELVSTKGSTLSWGFNRNLIIGGDQGGGEYFNGSLDQIRFFNRALDFLEVESLYRERTVLCGGQANTLDILGDNSCIATYQLNGNANDLSGNYSGTPTNVSYGVGEFDLAGVFNGSSSYITIGDYNVFSPVVNDLSVSLWFNTSVASGTKWLATKGAASNYEWAIYATSNGVVGCTMWQNGGSNCAFVFSPDNSYSIDTWHNVVVSMDYLGSLSIYLDGQLMGSTTTFVGSMINGSAPVLIGKRADQSVDMMNGLIDQLRIFNKALNSTEVTTLYNETACDALGCGGTTNTLDILSDGSCIAAYPLDGSPGDLSGNYNGVQTNVTYPVGKYDLSGSFNGSSSYLDIPSFSFGSNNISISMWVNPNSSQNAYSMLFDFEHSSSSAGVFAIQQNNAATNQYSVWQWNGSSYNVSTAFTLSANTWNHLVFTLQSNGSYVFYLGGASSVSGSGLTSPPSSLIKPLNIGRWQGNPNPGRYFSGQIDQVRFFNKALSAGEVTTLYNETACN